VSKEFLGTNVNFQIKIRSTSIAIAYLIFKLRISYQNAFEMVNNNYSEFFNESGQEKKRNFKP